MTRLGVLHVWAYSVLRIGSSYNYLHLTDEETEKFGNLPKITKP